MCRMRLFARGSRAARVVYVVRSVHMPLVCQELHSRYGCTIFCWNWYICAWFASEFARSLHPLVVSRLSVRPLQRFYYRLIERRPKHVRVSVYLVAQLIGIRKITFYYMNKEYSNERFVSYRWKVTSSWIHYKQRCVPNEALMINMTKPEIQTLYST